MCYRHRRMARALPARWLLVGLLAWGCGSEEAPADPLEALQSADRERLNDLLSQAEQRTLAGRQAAVAAVDFSLRAGLGTEAAKEALLRAFRWRELGDDCPLVEAWNRLAPEHAAYRRGRFSCAGPSEPTPPASEAARREVDALADHCVVTRLRMLDAGEGDLRVVLDLAGPCEFELEESPLRLRFSSLGRLPSIGESFVGPARSLNRLTFEGSGVRLAVPRGVVPSVSRLGERVVIDLSLPVDRGSVDDAPVIVLDPGHGGDDLGARFESLTESALALDIAQRAARNLRQRLPAARVFLTRETDVFIPLEERAVRANSLGADIFLSIHLNAANEAVHRGGVTTFVLDATDDSSASRLAARENGGRVHEVTGLQRLLASFHRRNQLAASRRLAQAVHRGTLEGGRRTYPALSDREVKSAMFYVLVGVRMPAALLEASFLTAPNDAAALARGDYRQDLAEGIATGLIEYLSEPVREEASASTGAGEANDP